MQKYTITQFRKDYPNDDTCLDKIFQLRYSNLICPKCEGTKKFARVCNRRSYHVLAVVIKFILLKEPYLKKQPHPLIYGLVLFTFKQQLVTVWLLKNFGSVSV